MLKIEDGKEKTYDLRYGVRTDSSGGDARSSYTWWL